MAGAGIDTAVGVSLPWAVPPDTIAILDNFCWCSSDEPERLGQLKLAAQGCYDFSKISAPRHLRQGLHVQ